MIGKIGVGIFLKENKINLFFSVLSGLLLSVSRLLVSWVLQNVIDCIVGRTLFDLIQILYVTILTFFIMGVAIIFDYIFSPKFINKAISQYRNYVFKRLMNKCPGSFLKENTATYLSLLTNDIDKIKKNYLVKIEVFVEIIVTFFGAVAMMLLCNPLLFAISLSISILPLFFSIYAGRSIPAKEMKLAKQNAVYVSFIKNVLSGFSVIKSFGSEKRFEKNHEDKTNDLYSAFLKREQANIVVSSTSYFLGNIAQIAVFIVCAVFAKINGDISAGTIVLFIQLIKFVTMPGEVLPKIWVERKATLSLLESHNMFLSSNVSENGKFVLDENNNSIDLKNVNFVYPGGCAGLKNINAYFEAGKCYLIVGKSGSGKTTLLNILSGIISNYEGSICYGDRELKDISRDFLFKYISLIQQNVYIFNDSIKNNITMYDDFEEIEIRNAIIMSGLDKMISEKGQDYMCGEGGGLSGGEKQMIAIARSILRKQKVLFIDEATSSLDLENTKKINNIILQLYDTTRFIVSHNIDTVLIENCDEILTIKDGEIIEKDSFQNLMKKRGYFYSLYTLSHS